MIMSVLLYSVGFVMTRIVFTKYFLFDFSIQIYVMVSKYIYRYRKQTSHYQEKQDKRKRQIRSMRLRYKLIHIKYVRNRICTPETNIIL